MTLPGIRVAADVVRHRAVPELVACHFLPLPFDQPLADDQDIWLGHVDPRWATARPAPDRMPPARGA
ncbi:hypothetical protein [Streptomyces sp. NPDC059080]|uniref:hypothetical protein n=1 Tax=Streptomyces sp. NPDC059080 TaxID=3346718 RepID=UPI003683321B